MKCQCIGFKRWGAATAAFVLVQRGRSRNDAERRRHAEKRQCALSCPFVVVLTLCSSPRAFSKADQLSNEPRWKRVAGAQPEIHTRIPPHEALAYGCAAACSRRTKVGRIAWSFELFNREPRGFGGISRSRIEARSTVLQSCRRSSSVSASQCIRGASIGYGIHDVQFNDSVDLCLI